MDGRDKIAESFRNKGYRATHQRIAITSIILGCRSHPSAEEVHEIVSRQYPTISLSTVYNTLHILKEIDFVNEINIKGKTRYDSNSETHINIICEECGKILDIQEPSIYNNIDNLFKKSGFRISGKQLSLYGVCSSCLRNNK